MPVGYYIIPQVAGPFSRENPQRPAYVDEIRCNWTGHNVDRFSVFVCKVNTTAAKHTDLAARTGVRQLPDWDTLISSLKVAQRNAISNWLGGRGLPYDATETIGQLIMRVINSGLFELGTEALSTRLDALSVNQRARIATFCNRWNVAYSDADTIRDLSDRAGGHWWHGPSLNVTEF